MAELRERPLSPHMSIWRWHITMASSIAHRATGVALYVGALIVAGWALALAGGAGSYQLYMELLGSWIGKIVLFGLTLSLFYHMANGIRHLIFDSGKGFDLKWADFGAAFAFTFAIVITVLVWVFAYFTGAF
jgi:succinate dehydrogenase / fumarate reductase cytochrome b subunit